MKKIPHLYSMTYKDLSVEMDSNGLVILPTIDSLPKYRLGVNYLVSTPLGGYVVRGKLTNNGSNYTGASLLQNTTNYDGVKADDIYLYSERDNSSFTTSITSSPKPIVYAEYNISLKPKAIEVSKNSTLSNLILNVPEMNVGDSFLISENGSVNELTVTSFSSSTSTEFEWKLTEISALTNITNLFRIIYDGSRFIALQGGNVSSNKLYISTDAVVWEEITLPIMAVWSDIMFSGTNYVITSLGSNIIYHSANLRVWFPAFLPTNQAWQSVSQGGNTFVVTGSNTDNSAYSSNAVVWQPSKLPNVGNWQSVTYGNGMFIAVTSSGSQNKSYAWSTDGVTWNKGTLPYITSLATVKYLNGKFFIILKNSKKILLSTDGLAWVVLELPVKSNWLDMAYGDNQYLMISDNLALTSFDGINWTVEQLPTNNQIILSSITYGDSKFVIISSNSDKILTKERKSTVYSNVQFNQPLSHIPSWVIKSGRTYQINGQSPFSTQLTYVNGLLSANFYTTLDSSDVSAQFSLLEGDLVQSISIKYLTSTTTQLDLLSPGSKVVYFSDGDSWHSLGSISGSIDPSAYGNIAAAVDAIANSLSLFIS